MLPHIRNRKAGRRSTGISRTPLLAIAFLCLTVGLMAAAPDAQAQDLQVQVTDMPGYNYVQVVIDGTPDMDCYDDCIYPGIGAGLLVELTAVAGGTDQVFEMWNGTDPPMLGFGFSPFASFPMPSNPVTAQASFLLTNPLTINFLGSGSGSVFCGPGSDSAAAGGTLTGSGVLYYSNKDSAVCTPTADIATSYFVAWAGAGSGALNRTFNLNVPRTASVTFEVVPEIRIDDVTLTEGNAGTVLFEFRVSIDKAHPGEDISVDYLTSDISATTGDNDYLPANGTLVFPAGSTASQVVQVTVNGDTTIELDETFRVTLSNPKYATIADAEGIGTITNDDLYRIVIDDQTVTEGSTAQFTVRLDQQVITGDSVTVDYATTSDTAADPADYTGHSTTTLTFGPGEDNKTIDVVTQPDTVVENQEHYTVDLSAPSANALISDPTGDGFIDDDGDTYTVSIRAVSPVSPVTENGDPSVTFTIELANVDALNGVVGGPITVDYDAVDGTAHWTSDFSGDISGTASFSGTTSTRDVVVLIDDDPHVEGAENFTFELHDPIGTALAAPSIETIVINDDAVDQYDITINDVSQVEDAGPHDFTVEFNPVNVDPDNGVAGTVTVNYATVAGSALATDDFAATSGVLTFNNASGPSQNIPSIAIVNDAVAEPDEAYTVELSGVTGRAAVSKSVGNGDILNDDYSLTVVVDLINGA
ncbi:MAG: hypothetical protein AMJ54_15860, partial [Deltaproteobacteria bacterium SG8_13]